MSEQGNYTGQVLEGRYRVERLLGRGGMGAVYEGRHVIVGKRVAIKMLHAEFAANEEVLKRFYREAQAAAAIGHKNIIDIMDVGVTPANEPYIVMEYLEGEDLEGMLQRTGPLSIEAACGILEPALQALEAAHAKGIVHRDLKPANIFLVRNEGGAPAVKLIDFGISKVTGGNKESRLTRTGTLLGTPAYMSPEQARGIGEVDHRVDIYAMGVILYQMLTGTLPFEGDNYNALLINVLTTEARRPCEIKPSIPGDAEALILKQLSKAPTDRSQSAREMLEELKELAAFAERASGMSFLGTKIHRCVAGGDLGSVVAAPGSSSSASRVLSEMAHKGTPGGWAGTAPGEGRSKGLLVGGIAAALVVAGVVAFVLTRGESTQPVIAPAVVPVAAPQPAAALPTIDEGVLITVEGAPMGATIIFNGAPVPMNPFRVTRTKTIFPLRVELAGYAPFAVSIVPSEDQKVAVAMKPLAVAGSERRKSEGHSSKPAPPSSANPYVSETKKAVAAAPAPPAPPVPAPPPAPAPSPKQDGKISKGKKGTMVSSDFE